MKVYVVAFPHFDLEPASNQHELFLGLHVCHGTSGIYIGLLCLRGILQGELFPLRIPRLGLWQLCLTWQIDFGSFMFFVKTTFWVKRNQSSGHFTKFEIDWSSGDLLK